MLGAPNILIAGAGYVGLHAALRLQHRLRSGEATITVVNPENFMLNAPLLPEVASGMLEPRQAVVPLRNVLTGCRIITGHLRAVDRDQQVATVETVAGDCVKMPYDHLVVALGSVTAVIPVPGLGDNAVGFRTLGEALYLHNEVLALLERAASTTDRAERAAALTFMFVGGGYAGVEALAELQHMAAATASWFPTVRPSDQRWIIVDAADRILATADPRLAGYAEGVL
ncbi:MAG: FAD-dependent oxidoreductase, partial [Actinomycetota bacterium]|nr:FAD-dependent oxidoreductase [Actinomycetota bacterium]